MEKLITGIHHVTAVSGDVQKNIDFYAGLLGLRLVKKTVNFDDPKVYHFYFGDELGTPGTIMTTFPYGSDLVQGRHGKGKINTTAFSLPLDSLDHWLNRLKKQNIPHKEPQQRFEDEVFIYMEDPDGMGIELVFNTRETRKGYSFSGHIPAVHAIRGIHHVALWLDAFEKTGALLTTVLDHKLIAESANRFRYGVEDKPGHYIDILCTPDHLRGLPGRGMVHHVAFEAPSAQAQLKVMERLQSFGLASTEVKDRKYFTSIYFNEPGGVIFEVATSGPGFAIDEDIPQLGLDLQLPAQFEEKRGNLRETLPALNYPPKKSIMAHSLDIKTAGKALDEAEKALIMIHGRGGSAADILGLSQHLNVTGFALLAPQATNHTWYPYSFIAPATQNEPWLTSAIDIIGRTAKTAADAGIKPENIYFFGFSQGACLTLEFIARNAQRYGGAAAIIGGVIGEKVNRENYQGDFEQTPVFIGTSNPDFHVPVERVYATENILSEMNAAVTLKVYENFGHSINQEEIDLANKIIFKQ